MNDVAAERLVLGGVFSGGTEVYSDIADIVTPSTFTLDSNQVIWKCLEYHLKDSESSKVDYPSILSAANSLGLSDFFSQKEEVDHLRAIINAGSSIDVSNVRRMAGKIRKLEIARLLDGQLDKAKRDLSDITGEESIDKILATAESPIFDFSSLLANTDNRTTKKMGDGASEYLSYLMDNPRQLMGISTGFKRYDEAIGGGLRPNSVDMIVARLKMGKSFFVDNIATYIAGQQNIPVLNIDTEMAWEEHLHRVAANISGFKINDIETGMVGKNPFNRKRLLEAAKKLDDMPYYYRCVSGEIFEETLAHLRRWVIKEVGLNDNGKAKPCVIIYDYLKIMGAEQLISSGMAEYQMLGFITTAIKNFANRYHLPILAFGQMNREGIDTEDTSSVAGSDRIAMYATSLSIYKKQSDEEISEQNEDFPYTHKLMTIASRHGKGTESGDFINIRAKYAVGKIEEGPLRSEMRLTQPQEDGQSGETEQSINF